MVDREVNIDVNSKGLEEAKDGIENLKQGVSELSSDIQTLEANVTSLNEALRQLSTTSSTIRRNIGEVTQKIMPPPEPQTRAPEPEHPGKPDPWEGWGNKIDEYTPPPAKRKQPRDSRGRFMSPSSLISEDPIRQRVTFDPTMDIYPNIKQEMERGIREYEKEYGYLLPQNLPKVEIAPFGVNNINAPNAHAAVRTHPKDFSKSADYFSNVDKYQMGFNPYSIERAGGGIAGNAMHEIGSHAGLDTIMFHKMFNNKIPEGLTQSEMTSQFWNKIPKKMAKFPMMESYRKALAIVNNNWAQTEKIRKSFKEMVASLSPVMRRGNFEESFNLINEHRKTSGYLRDLPFDISDKAVFNNLYKEAMEFFHGDNNMPIPSRYSKPFTPSQIPATGGLPYQLPFGTPPPDPPSGPPPQKGTPPPNPHGMVPFPKNPQGGLPNEWQPPQKGTQRYIAKVGSVSDDLLAVFVSDFNRLLGNDFKIKMGRKHFDELGKPWRELTAVTQGLLTDVGKNTQKVNDSFLEMLHTYIDVDDNFKSIFRPGESTFELLSTNEYNRISEQTDKVTKARARARDKAWKERQKAEQSAGAGLNRMMWSTGGGRGEGFPEYPPSVIDASVLGKKQPGVKNILSTLQHPYSKADIKQWEEVGKKQLHTILDAMRSEANKPEGAVINASELLRRAANKQLEPFTKKYIDVQVPQAKTWDLQNAINVEHGQKAGSFFEVTPQGKMVPGVTRPKGTIANIKEMAAGLGKTIDQLTSKSGALGRVGWTFTSLAMGALGVYFSLMGIVNMIQQGLGAMFNPLKNLESFVQAYAYSKMIFDDDSMVNIDNFMKKLGIDIGDVAKASMYLNGVLGTITASIGAFGAKVLLDPEVQKNIEQMIKMLQDFLLDPETMNLAKGIFKGMAEALPGVLDGIKLLGWLIQHTILPYAGIFAKLWAVALVAMPIFSVISALTNLVKVLGIIPSAIMGIATAFKLVFSGAEYVTVFGRSMRTLSSLAGAGGATAGAAYASAFLLGVTGGLAGAAILEKTGVLNYVSKKGYEFAHPGETAPEPNNPNRNWWNPISLFTESPYVSQKDIPQLATGGITTQEGIVNIHPNEAIIPLSKLITNMNVASNTEAVEENTRATQKLNEILTKGTNPVYPTNKSPGGGPTVESLSRVGNWTLSQNGKTWNMNTSVALRDQYVSGQGVEWFGGQSVTGKDTDIETPEIPKASGMGIGTSGLGIGVAMAIPSALVHLKSLLKSSKTYISSGMKAISNVFKTGAKTVASPLTQEIDEMLGVGVKGAKTFEILGETQTLTKGGFLSKFASPAMSVLGSAVSKALFPIGIIQGLESVGAWAHGASTAESTPMDEKGIPLGMRVGSKDLKYINDSVKETNTILKANQRQVAEDAYETNSLLASVKNGILSMVGKTGFTGLTNSLTQIVTKLNEGLRVDDFKPGGPGWKSRYTPGAKVPNDQLSDFGAPSVNYGGIDPYAGTALKNGQWTNFGTAENPNWWYTDATGTSFKGDGSTIPKGAVTSKASSTSSKTSKKGTGWSATTPFKDQVKTNPGFTGLTTKSVADTNTMKLNIGGEELLVDKRNFNITELETAMKQAATSQAHAAKYADVSNESYGEESGDYETDGAGNIYKIYPNGTRVLWRKAPSLAVGGIIKEAGLIQAHAAEVISPISSITDMIDKVATARAEKEQPVSQNITYDIDVIVQGNATTEVTDDMIIKIKRELFGRNAPI